MAARLTKATQGLTRSDILAAFVSEALSPHSWSNGPRERYAPHSHSYHKVLYCVQGSIVFRIEDAGEEYELTAGDRLDIGPGTWHSAIVGAAGVECVEAARG